MGDIILSFFIGGFIGMMLTAMVKAGDKGDDK